MRYLGRVRDRHEAQPLVSQSGHIAQSGVNPAPNFAGVLISSNCLRDTERET